MSRPPSFEWVPIERLRAHERTDPAAVRHLAAEFRAAELFGEPIWVARGSYIILNGHHRWTALRELGARRVPAWMFDYLDDPEIALERWAEGPPITKAEVVRAAETGLPFPVKTTRHVLAHPLPAHPVPLCDLFDADGAVPDSRPPRRAAQK